MARTLPTGQSALYLGTARRRWHTVEVQNEAGTWIDLTPFWRGFTWAEEQDAGAASGTLRLRREAMVGGVLTSLAPLVQASTYNTVASAYSPLLNPFRAFRFRSAVVAATTGTPTVPGGAAYVTVAQGVIDDPSWGGKASVIDLNLRDSAAPLQDALIEEERIYGSEEGTPIEDVLQSILDDNGFDTLTVAVVGDTDGWSLKPYKQARGVSVWDACRALALQMGWDWRFWWSADGSTYAPTLLEPRRDTETVDVTLTAAQFLDVPSLRLNGTDVRNAGELPWRNDATGEAGLATQEDAGSILAYGRRAFWLDYQPNIDTADEAQQMIDAAVADMATPFVDGSAVLPYLPSLQLGDVLQFPATTPLHDEVQRFGVTGYRHEVTPERAITTPTLRGRPVGAYQRWLALMRQRAADLRLSSPAPTIGPMLGEASADGGGSGDGACWLFVTFEPNTDAVEVYNATGPASPLAAPSLDANNLAAIVRRQEGALPSSATWATLLFFATTPDYYKRAWCRSFGPGAPRREGLPQSFTAQAVDGFTATLGAITSFGVTRDDTDNVLTWTAGASTSPHALWLLVWRNGGVIALLPFATSGSWTDADVLVDRDYVYEVQVFTHDGVASAQSGPRTSVHRAPETPVSTAPVFVGDTPKTIFSEMIGIPGTVTLPCLVDAQCTDPDCATIEAQRYNGALGLWVTAASAPNIIPGFPVGMSFDAAPFPTVRLRSKDAAGVVLAHSAPKISVAGALL